MELVKDVVVDFCLFSLIEGFIFCLFFEKIGGCRKFKWYEVLILSIGNCIISQVFPPIIYQIIAIFYMSILLNLLKIEKIFKCLKIVITSMILMMIIEMIFAMIYEVLFKIDFVHCNDYLLFLFVIPIRAVEILLINIFRRK